MRVKYFVETDTNLIEFSTNPIVETKELDKNTYMDFDENGRIVSITIEHASNSMNVEEFLYQRIPTASD